MAYKEAKKKKKSLKKSSWHTENLTSSQLF